MGSHGILRNLIDDGCGITAIEYGVIAALIAVATLLVLGTAGTVLVSVFGQIASNLAAREREALTIASAVREWISAGRPLIYTGTGHDGGLRT